MGTIVSWAVAAVVADPDAGATGWGRLDRLDLSATTEELVTAMAALGRRDKAGASETNDMCGGETGMKRGEMSFAPMDEDRIRFGPKIRSSPGFYAEFVKCAGFAGYALGTRTLAGKKSTYPPQV
jgi:hypothetical protein